MPQLLRRYFTTPSLAVVLDCVTLAAAFLHYGSIKLTGRQFVYDWQEQTFVRGGEHGHTIIWYFFGYSRVYGTFIAMAAIVPMLLLVWPRTARLGTLILFAASANNTLMDRCFDVTLLATLFVGAPTVALGGRMWRDRRELLAMLLPRAPSIRMARKPPQTAMACGEARSTDRRASSGCPQPPST